MKHQRQASTVNLARHLNDQYPDTVLFLARMLGARPAADSARINAIQDDAIDITVCIGKDVEAVRLPSPTTADKDTSLRERISELVVQARALDADGLLTSLEQQIAQSQWGCTNVSRPGTVSSRHRIAEAAHMPHPAATKW